MNLAYSPLGILPATPEPDQLWISPELARVWARTAPPSIYLRQYMDGEAQTRETLSRIQTSSSLGRSVRRDLCRASREKVCSGSKKCVPRWFRTSRVIEF